MKNTDRSSVRRTALLLALSLLFSLAACGKGEQDGGQGSDAPAETVSDASGPDTQTSMKFYENKVERMPVSDGTSQGLLYSEVLDFEADGNPELLVLSIDDFAQETPGLSTPFKNVIFRRNRMSFFAGQHTGVYSLNYRPTCRLEARQVLIYQCILDLTGENGKYNYSKAAHLYPPLSYSPCSAKNYKIASALTLFLRTISFQFAAPTT